MRQTQSRARRAPIYLALLVIALVVTACGAPGAPQATPSGPGTPAVATQAAPQATAQSAPAGTAAPGSQEAGASANLSPAAKFTTHWKGDPNAKVVIIEVSDFQ